MKNLPSPWFYNTFFCKKFTVSRKKKRFSHLQDFLLGIGKYIDRAVENFRFSYHASVVRGENHCRHSSKLDWTNYVRKRLMLFLRAYKYIHKDTNGVMYEVGMCNWLNMVMDRDNKKESWWHSTRIWGMRTDIFVHELRTREG